jgi:hypothetical protein
MYKRAVSSIHATLASSASVLKGQGRSMDALKIALETIFVGVLALPWLTLASQLFFPKFSLSRTADFEGWLPKLWPIKNEAIGYAVVGVLSVAMAYTLGAALSRLAQDFFNDDDLLLHVPTEDQIRASVYCDQSESTLVEITVPFEDNSETCKEVPAYWFQRFHAHGDMPRASDRIRQIFDLQESALLLAGEDKVSKLRLLHQQIMVLRGVAFDGLITFVLCLLGWNVKQSWGPWRWKPWRGVLPIGILVYALYALLWNHLGWRDIKWNLQLLQNPFQLVQLKIYDPPFMELTLLLFGAGGCYAAWKSAKGLWPQGTGWVSLLFAALAYAGWYWSEILYDRLVIYSFYASEHLLKTTL